MSNYSDLINIDALWEKRENFSPDRWEVSFYCKDCEELVQTERPNPKGYVFTCKICDGKNVSVGTQEGLKSRYRIKS